MDYLEWSPNLKIPRDQESTYGTESLSYLKMMALLYCFYSKTWFYEKNTIISSFIYLICHLKRLLYNEFSTKYR